MNDGAKPFLESMLCVDPYSFTETESKRSQELLYITYHTAQKYHVEFGMPKTKYLRSGKSKNQIELNIGGRVIEETEKYTYLGEVMNKHMKLSDHIRTIGGKVEAAYQTIVAVAEDQNFKNIKMECVWKLVKYLS